MRGIDFDVGQSLFHRPESERVTHALGAFGERSATEQVEDLRMDEIRDLLGRDEVQKIVDDGEPIEIKCQFCGKKYRFSQEELQAVLKKTEKNA